MGITTTFDLDALLVPISAEQPAGEDLRADLSPTPLYYSIKDVRTEARAAERQGQFEAVIGPAEAAAWKPVLKIGMEALQQRSKDLEVVSWMTEAMLRVEGFPGLWGAFRLMREYVEAFWEELYPRMDEDGMETKVAPITGLNGAGAEGTLVAPISRIPVLGGGSGEPLAIWSCVQAQDLERLEPEARASRIAAGSTSMEDVIKAVRGTPAEELADTVRDIEGCLEEWTALHAALTERCGAEAPPSSSVRDALQTSLDTLRFVARDHLPAAEAVEESSPVEEVGESEGADPAAPAPARAQAPGEIRTREDAFKVLSKVAEFFHRTEPHTPISFMLQRTVRWGSLPLPDLLRELIPDESARTTYQQLTGVSDSESTSETD